MVKMFQNDVAYKLTLYLNIKFKKLEQSNNILFNEIVSEYFRQIEIVSRYNKLSIPTEESVKLSLLRCLSEPKTNYYLHDANIHGDRKIYSPRIDLSITPIIETDRNCIVSIGNYKLSDDVQLFKMIHGLDFIKRIENELRIKSISNFDQFGLQPRQIARFEDINSYINKRPLHLFGIEIENQKNSKHLMGDFLNSISLSKIPIIVVPKENLTRTMDMIIYCKTIFDVKEVPVYKLFSEVIILTIDQFRDTLNELLREEEVEEIQVREYL